MATIIKKKTVSGVGPGTVDMVGFPYVKFYNDNGPLRIEFTGVTPNFPKDSPNWVMYCPTATNIQVPVNATGIKIDDQGMRIAWSVDLCNVDMAKDQSVLQISKTSGNYLFSGDEELTYKGQDTAAAADISGIRVNFEELQRLFTKAIVTKTVSDAARYVKFKEKLLNAQ